MTNSNQSNLLHQIPWRLRVYYMYINARHAMCNSLWVRVHTGAGRANQSFKCMRSLIGDHNFAIVDYPDLMLPRILTKAPVSLTPTGRSVGINKKPVPANDLFNQANWCRATCVPRLHNPRAHKTTQKSARPQNKMRHTDRCVFNYFRTWQANRVSASNSIKRLIESWKWWHDTLSSPLFCPAQIYHQSDTFCCWPAGA
jgi:hypothetical protein